MNEDLELLRKFVESDDQQAFASLVSRHINLVYSAAVRQLNGDEHLAADVVQQVFTDLARKSPDLRTHQNLSGWLYTGSFYAAAKMARGAERRRTREESERMRREIDDNFNAKLDWDEVRPVLDNAMHELNEEDRNAILLRFFQEKEVSEVAGILGVTSNAARMRVDRALDKLRMVLEKRGITSTAAALGVMLTAQTIQAAPVSLGGSVTTHAILLAKSSGALAGGGAVKWFAMTKTKAAVATAILAAGVSLPVAYYYSSLSSVKSVADKTSSASLINPQAKLAGVAGTGQAANVNSRLPQTATATLKKAYVIEPSIESNSSAPLTGAPATGAGQAIAATPSFGASTAVSRSGTGLFGKVVLNGTPPPEKEITPLAQDPSCGSAANGPVFTRHYIVGQGNGLGNVVVYVKQGLEGMKFPIPDNMPMFDQKNCLFEPYILGVMTGQKLTIRNSDPILHNVHATPTKNREFNFAQPVMNQMNVKSFDVPEVAVRIKCDVHNWMFGYIAVIDHPFFTITDANGDYEIPNLPPGDYIVEAYHLKAGIAQMKITGSSPRATMMNFSLKVPAAN